MKGRMTPKPKRPMRARKVRVYFMHGKPLCFTKHRTPLQPNEGVEIVECMLVPIEPKKRGGR